MNNFDVEKYEVDNVACSMTMTVEEIKIISSMLDFMLVNDTCDEREYNIAIELLERLGRAAQVGMGTFYVNVYKMYRAYGGPEEGGWYYDAADLYDTIPSMNLDDAIDVIPALIDEYFEDVDQSTVPLREQIEKLYLRSSSIPTERYVTIEESPDYYNGYYVIKVESMPGQSARLEAPIYE